MREKRDFFALPKCAFRASSNFPAWTSDKREGGREGDIRERFFVGWRGLGERERERESHHHSMGPSHYISQTACVRAFIVKAAKCRKKEKLFSSSLFFFARLALTLLETGEKIPERGKLRRSVWTHVDERFYTLEKGWRVRKSSTNLLTAHKVI